MAPRPTTTLAHHPVLGALLTLAGTGLFSIQDATVKWLSADFLLLQLMFVRSIVALVPLSVALRLRYGPGAWQTRRPLGHALRAALNLTAFLSYYYAITRLPLAEATALALSMPLFLALFSGVFLRESAGPRVWIALVAGFVGVLVIVRPGGADVDWIGAGAALLGSMLFALLGIQTRNLARSESSELMVFFSAAAFLVLTGLVMPWLWRAPDAASLALMVSLGVVSVSAQYCIVHAFRFAPVYVLGPFEYTGLVWAVLFGWIFFAEIPGAGVIAGAGLVVGSGIYVVTKERTATA